MASELRQAAQQEVSPDSLRGIVEQTQSHLNEIEKRLNTIIDRLGMSPAITGIAEKNPVAEGVIGSAVRLRVTCTRIIDLCVTIDNMI